MDTTNGKLELARKELKKLADVVRDAAADQETAATQYETACYRFYRVRAEHNEQLKRVCRLEREAGMTE